MPSLELALAIALEWDSQTVTGRGIQPATMPMMTLASTAIDQVKVDPSIATAQCLSYLSTDTALVYAHPEERELLKLQHETFQPLINTI